MSLACDRCALVARAFADWDSYWVVLGLLSVGMHDTAASLTANLIDAVHAYGFVPNGLRTYYLGRAPPAHTPKPTRPRRHDAGGTACGA